MIGNKIERDLEKDGMRNGIESEEDLRKKSGKEIEGEKIERKKRKEKVGDLRIKRKECLSIDGVDLKVLKIEIERKEWGREREIL